MIDGARALLMKPGDLLIIGNVGPLDEDVAESLSQGLAYIKDNLGLAGIVVFESDVDLTLIDNDGVER